MKWCWVFLMITTSLGLIPTTYASNAPMEVSACLFSPVDMLRQPKNLPPVLADSTFNCGKHGEASLVRFYERGWRLIQVLPNGSYINPWIGIFERQKP